MTVAVDPRVVARLAAGAGTVLESRIDGVSMQPTLPHGARIRIRPIACDDYREGQIIACVLGDALFAHRVVYVGRSGRRKGFVLTQGDGWTLCDPPTPVGNIVGAVSEYFSAGAWRIPAPPPVRNGWSRFASAESARLIRVCLGVHYQLARHVAGLLLYFAAASGWLRSRPALPG